jgi:hypothetical protein
MNLNRAFALNKANDFSDAQLRRQADANVHVIGHRVAFEHLNALLLKQLSQQKKVGPAPQSKCT